MLTDVGGPNRPLFLKTCHTYRTIMKLGTLIPYLKEIKKIHESSDMKSALFAIAKTADIDCISINNFKFF